MDVVGTKWYIKEPGSQLYDSVWEFLEDGSLICDRAGEVYVEKWEYSDGYVIVNFTDGYAYKTCKINGDCLTGHAMNCVKDTWTITGELLSSPTDNLHDSVIHSKEEALGEIESAVKSLPSDTSLKSNPPPFIAQNHPSLINHSQSLDCLASSSSFPSTIKAEASPLKKVQDHFDAQDIVQATIICRIKGGYEAQVLEREAFLPGSHSLVKGHVVAVDEDPLIGTIIPVIILEIKYPLQLVVSHREAKAKLASLEREAAEEARQQRQQAHLTLKQRQREELSSVNIGDIIEAQVDHMSSKSVALHAGSLYVRVDCEEVGWGKSPQPPVLGTIIQVVITGRDEEKLCLQASIRLLTPDPWSSIAERYRLGQTTTALVKRVVKFGLFVELEPAIVALVHRSTMLDATAQTDLEDCFSPGDRIPIAVESFDGEAQKMGALLTVTLREWGRLQPLQHELREAAHQATATSQQVTTLERQICDLQEVNAQLQQQRVEELKYWQELIQAQQEECENLRAVSKASAEQRHESEQALKLQISKAKFERDETLIKVQQATRSLQIAERQSQQLQACSNQHAEALSNSERQAQQLQTRSNQQVEALTTWRNKTAQLEQQLNALQNKVAATQTALPVTWVVPDALTKKLEAHYNKAQASSFYQVSIKDSHQYCCLLPYLPTRIQGTAEQQADRQFVFAFKDGRNSFHAAYRIAIALLRSFSPLDLKEAVFAVIPASTQAKNVLRFESFCQQVCEMTGMVNGYDLIVPIQDRGTLKGTAFANKVENLRYDSGRIANRSIMLFDDVMTSGTSFTQNASRLKSHGASKVTGVFLARTVDTR